MMKKRIALLLCICLIVFAPLSALAGRGTGDRACIFSPNLSEPYGVVRMDDGALLAVGEKVYEETQGWTNIKEIHFNGLCTIGLTNDGKVLLGREDGLVKGYRITDALKWKNIAEADWYGVFVFGLDANGTLHVTSGDDYNRTLVGHHKANGWDNVAQFAVNGDIVAALQTDGTVRVLDERTDKYGAADAWTDIVQIACTDSNLFGLRSDGAVVQCGRYEYASAALWTDVRELVADGLPTIGAIKNDGTVAGDDSYGAVEGVEEWRDVRKLIADADHLYAIGPDGGLLTTNGIVYGEEWHDLADIWLDGNSVAGLRTDGVVIYKNRPYAVHE